MRGAIGGGDGEAETYLKEISVSVKINKISYKKIYIYIYLLCKIGDAASNRLLIINGL